jgi:hypothetical protein
MFYQKWTMSDHMCCLDERDRDNQCVAKLEITKKWWTRCMYLALRTNVDFTSVCEIEKLVVDQN